MNVVTQLTQFVCRDVINKNTTDLAVRCSTGSVELSCVAIDTPLIVASRKQVRFDIKGSCDVWRGQLQLSPGRV